MFKKLLAIATVAVAFSANAQLVDGNNCLKASGIPTNSANNWDCQIGLAFEPALVAGTTYTWSFDVIGAASSTINIWGSFVETYLSNEGWKGSDDYYEYDHAWYGGGDFRVEPVSKHYEIDWTPGYNDGGADYTLGNLKNITINLGNYKAETLWIDNVKLVVKGEDTNLIENADFSDPDNMVFYNIQNNYTLEIVPFDSSEIVPPTEVEYENIITNGDASADWDNPALTIADAGWMNICAWGKEDKGDPHPANIETLDGDRRFVVHATAMTENPWDNQFWICAPREFANGDEFKVSFKLKATADAAPGTQAHKEPSNYMHWAAIGNPQFTTDWTSFEAEVKAEGSLSGMWSIAFNLNDYNPANDYYVDDIKLEVAKLQEGWFVASDALGKGSLGAAKEMVWDEDSENFFAVVGTDATPATYVKISTVKGSDGAFNAHTIYVEDESTIEDGEYVDYIETAGKKINLPEPGVWGVFLDPEFAQVMFTTDVEGGIHGIANDDNATAVYYNLQGVRVDNPTQGVYIVKKGNRVSKQVIR